MHNLLLMTDSYKASHYLQYPPGTQAMFSYLESRGGKYDRTVFFGLQYLVKEYLSKPITKIDLVEARDFFKAHGTPFPEESWQYVIDKYGGYLPLQIRAVPEGMVVPTHNALLTCRSLDERAFWLVTWIEAFLMRLWYPITVATQSWFIKNDILGFLRETSDDPNAEINFKLHDFGARGVSSSESAGIGGAAHLVNFLGSDTIEGVFLANKFYDCPMAAFSIPAAEHSTITSWGPEREYQAFQNMLDKFAGPGKLVAVVSDSYDIYAATKWWADQSEKIKATGGTVVIRPDSGDPVEVVTTILDILSEKGLMTVNSKGYRVLQPHIRVIQGDGVDRDSIRDILQHMKDKHYSASNIAFGMGGALLQKVNRDTQKMAYKCSAVQIAGAWQDVYKDPVTDPGKKSKRGLLDLRYDADSQTFETVNHHAWDSILQKVYDIGPKEDRYVNLDFVRRLAESFRP